MVFFISLSGLEMSTCPLAQASVKNAWGSTNPRLFVAVIKGTRHWASAVKIKFSTLHYSEYILPIGPLVLHYIKVPL